MSLTLTRRHNVDRFGYLIPTRYGNVPLVGAVATYRPGEGRFGGAVAVEEGTTNLVSSNRSKFEGWIAYSGAQVTLTQNVEFPEIGRNDATRIRTTGGTIVLKYFMTIGQSIADQAYTGSVYIKNIGPKPVRFSTNLGPLVTVNPGEWTRAIISVIGNGTTQYQLRFESLNVNDDLDFIAWGPQVEYKPFATSFVAGTRAAGALSYPITLGRKGTIGFWWNKSKRNASGHEMPFRLANNVFEANIRDVSASVNGVSASVSWNPGEWHHFAYAWDMDASGTKQWLFIDGQLKATSTSVLPDPTAYSTLYVGWGGDGYWFNGLIAELLILPYAASEEEIRSWYEADGPIPPHPAALLQWDWQAVRPATMVAL